MQFKLDENLPGEVADLLRDAGHDVETVNDEGLQGAKEPVLADVVRREGRILLTFDIGFGDIRSYPPADYAGLLVLRLGVQDKASTLAVCTRLVTLLEQQSPRGQLWIVEDTRVRIHE